MITFVDECNDIVSIVQDLLSQNQEWNKRYEKYSHTIDVKNKLDQIISNKRRFREWKPLYLYLTLGQAMGKMMFSLRYRGQDVAKLSVGKDKITIDTDKYAENNKDHFGCKVKLTNCEWTSKEAQAFRKSFSNHPIREKSKKENEEHRLESLLLTEFTKKISKGKCILNIQPVRIANVARFQLPTPLKASEVSKTAYAFWNGGGIDIISRIGIGRATRLCIMEVKDENTSKEPPAKVILQGLAYAKFVRDLLRSNSGDKWWNIFGFKGKCPKTIDISVVCVMPSTSNDDTSFEGEIIKAATDSSDTFHLHYLYFTEENNIITDMKTSLPQCKVKADLSECNQK